MALAWAVASGLTSYVIGWLVFRLLNRLRVLDVPNERSSHSEVTVRGGGVSIVVPLIFVLGFLTLKDGSIPVTALLVGVVIVSAISLLDDIYSLPVRVRLIGQLVASSIFLVSSSWSFFRSTVSQSESLLLLSAGLLFLIWIVGYSNAFNFMDGINGLAGFQAAITSCFTLFVIWFLTGQADSGPFLASAVLAGAAIGFLPHNFPSARMFMGDVGSVTVGFSLASVVVWSCIEFGTMVAIPLLLIHSNFVLDTGVTLVRRILRKERWWTPHRSHFYQIWLRSGASHSRVTLTELVLQIICSLLLALFLLVESPWRTLLPVASILIWLGYFIFCEFQWSRFQEVKNNEGG